MWYLIAIYSMRLHSNILPCIYCARTDMTGRNCLQTAYTDRIYTPRLRLRATSLAETKSVKS